ncbi:MAG: hypothetical protein V4597_14595 [Pseudomonadota bacterium]
MAKRINHRDRALADVAEDQQPAVIAAAEFLHRNESMHMHEDVGSKDPCGYCWLRARYAHVAIQKAGFALIHREQQDGGQSHG